jgi:MerR family mercuric resistance operon transcriptional regulator
MSERYTIGTLAQQVGLNVESIRYYQRRGLVDEPAKPLGGIRHYGDEHARRLRFVKEAQKLGFSLEEVGELLSLEDGLHCREVEELASHKLAAVRERMAQLGKIEAVLAVLVGKCHGNRGKLRCPLISSLETPHSPVTAGTQSKSTG